MTAQLGTTTDPKALIPGEAAAINGIARQMQTYGDALREAGAGLIRLDTTDGWSGPAAERFRETFQGNRCGGCTPATPSTTPLRLSAAMQRSWHGRKSRLAKPFGSGKQEPPRAPPRPSGTRLKLGPRRYHQHQTPVPSNAPRPKRCSLGPVNNSTLPGTAAPKP